MITMTRPPRGGTAWLRKHTDNDKELAKWPKIQLQPNR